MRTYAVFKVSKGALLGLKTHSLGQKSRQSAQWPVFISTIGTKGSILHDISISHVTIKWLECVKEQRRWLKRTVIISVDCLLDLTCAFTRSFVLLVPESWDLVGQWCHMFVHLHLCSYLSLLFKFLWVGDEERFIMESSSVRVGRPCAVSCHKRPLHTRLEV